MRPRGRRHSQRRAPADTSRPPTARLKPGPPAAAERAGAGIQAGDGHPIAPRSGDARLTEALSADVPPGNVRPSRALPGAVETQLVSSPDAESLDSEDADDFPTAEIPRIADHEADLRAGLPEPGDLQVRLPEGDLAELGDVEAGLPEGDLAEPGRRRADLPGDQRPDSDRPGGDRPGGDRPGGDRPGGDRPDSDLPEVELTDVEVAEVLSGRVIPIGPFSARGPVPLAGPAAGADVGSRAPAEPGSAFLTDATRMALAWAQERNLGLSSACGISVALAACASAWFSAGTRSDIVRGVAALWGGYLVLLAGQRLAGTARLRPDASSAAGGAASAGQRRASSTAWLAALGGSLAECVVYAGLAVGAAAERWNGVWTLALAVLSLVAIRNLMTVCSTPPGFGEHSDSAFRRISEAVLTMPVGGRVLLIGIVAPIWGARATLLALLDWAIIAIGYGIAGRAAPGVAAMAKGSVLARPLRERSLLLRLRDDGGLARKLGALVQGNLLPLPPAVLGLAAISALAVLGLHGLPGALTIGPAIVMLLAAPGSANPHAGRFDWLVPVLLLSSQFLYLMAIGLAVRVPGAVIFVLGAALLLRYTDLACPGRPVLLAKPRHADGESAERGSGLGWEGRSLLAGLAAAMGIATFAYLALTAYLGVLICAKVVTSCLASQEDKRP